jgi:hypothetical protein
LQEHLLLQQHLVQTAGDGSLECVCQRVLLPEMLRTQPL